jgi:hypothetical protein
MDAQAHHPREQSAAVRWSREIVVERDDGKVLLFTGRERDGVDGVIRARRAGDLIDGERF